MTSASLSTESVYDEKECLVKSGKDKVENPKDSAYLGSTKRKTPPSQRGQERQLELCNSQASDNRFSMTSTSLSTDSVYEEKRFPAKSGKDAFGQYEKTKQGYFAK